MPYRRVKPKKSKWSSLIGKKVPKKKLKSGLQKKKKIPGVLTPVSKAPKYKGAPLAPKLKKKKKLSGKLGVKTPAQIKALRLRRRRRLVK
jgi:hypothetical protein